MRLSRLGYLLVALVLFTSAATALQLDIQGEKDWLVAGSDIGHLSIHIQPGQGESPQSLTLTPRDTQYCTVAPSSVLLTSNDALVEVKSGIRSGVCDIDVRVSYQKNGNPREETQLFTQKIDHAAPIKMVYYYTPSVTVGSFVPITTKMTDVYGNLVDNRNKAETVTFDTTGMSGFVDADADVDGTTPLQIEQHKVIMVDGSGTASVAFFVGSGGANYIRITPPATVTPPPPIFTITGRYDGEPASISSEVSPAAATPPWVYADGTSRFRITYFLTDTRGYPCELRYLEVQSPAGTFRVLTNNEGKASFLYPASTTPGLHTLTVTAVDNTSATTKNEVEFISGRPVNLMMSANPISMPSLDVKSTQVSEINGRISDFKGNPSAGEQVTFELISIAEDPGNVTHPFLTNAQGTRFDLNKPFTVTTNSEGTALVYFHPGGFQTDKKARQIDPMAPEYNPDATGTAEVRGTWNGQSEVITLTWKNTPYLSISTDVSPKVLKVGEEVTVTIRVEGNGALLSGLPVDVILVIDRSGSMWFPVPGDADRTQRLEFVKNGAKIFVDSLDPGKDRVGIVTFETRGSLEQPLTSNFESVKATISDLSIPPFNQFIPYKGPLGASNLRDGLYQAIKAIENDAKAQSPGRVKAIVLLSDGEFNWYGTPLAQGRGYALTTKINKCYNYEGNNCPQPTSVTDMMWWPGLLMPNDYTYYNDLGGPLYYTGDGCKDRFGKEIGGSCGDLCYPSYTSGGTRYTGNWFPAGVNVWQTTHQDPCPLSNFRIEICPESPTSQCLFTKQNMSVYARSVNAEIYSIGFAEDFNTPRYVPTRQILTVLSEATGGKFYSAKTGKDLEDVYKKIGKELIRSAGLQTELSPDRSNIRIGGEVLSDGVYQYVYRKDKSTTIHSWNYTSDGKPKDVIPFQTKDQTDDWKANKVKFTIGTMTIGQIWEAQYILKTLKPGWAEVFGPASSLTFRTPEGKSETVPFPQQNITVRGKDEPVGNAYLDILNARAEQGGSTVTTVPEYTTFDVAWELDFQDEDNGRAQQWYEITSDSDPTFGEKTHLHPTDAGPAENPQPYSLTQNGGLPEGTYTITIYARDGSKAFDAEPFPLTVGHKDEKAVIILR
ncbi:MAG: VWA domain-containing protein [Methanomicrobiales archaeon]|nr:VWA domain-containing protein [Methanomicrobiales archaeon]